MMYVTYDKDTGSIVSFGYMDKAHIENQITHGQPLLIVDQEITSDMWRVDLDTKQLVKR